MYAKRVHYYVHFSSSDILCISIDHRLGNLESIFCAIL